MDRTMMPRTFSRRSCGLVLAATTSSSMMIHGWCVQTLAAAAAVSIHSSTSYQQSAFLSSNRHRKSRQQLARRMSTARQASTSTTDDAAAWSSWGDWISLVPEDPTAVTLRTRTPVSRAIAESSSSDSPPTSSNVVEIDYRGTLAKQSWTAHDVVQCWLSQQQGLPETLADAFLERNITSAQLEDEHFFTDNFVAETLQISNRIQCKKLVMAAKRLGKDRVEHPVGTDFDSSYARGTPYSFPVGQNKAIRAMDLAVAQMTVGQMAQLRTRCDYAYGKDGLRTGKGDVIVPPFATLVFEIELLRCSAA